VPTFGPSSPSASEFVLDDMHVTVHPGASTIVIGEQTITYGGPLVTLSNHDVLSLGPAGLVIQMPSGKVSTVTVPASTSAQITSSQTASASKSIGSIIASSELSKFMYESRIVLANSSELIVGGLGNTTASAQSMTSTQSSPSQPPSTTSTSITIPAGSGGRVSIENGSIWIAGCFLMAILPWV
jgi:hypothetical protein